MTELGCGKCGSRRVIPEAKIISCVDHPNLGLTVAVARKPQAALFRGEVHSKLTAHVCGECGFTEFFAADAGALFDEYLEAQRALTVDSGA